MVQPYKPLYSVEEVANVLETGVPAVYELLNLGLLPHLIIRGEKYRVAKRVRGSDLEAFIENWKPEEPVK